jgi:O-antigen/teichoic acid export membrane protein
MLRDRIADLTQPGRFLRNAGLLFGGSALGQALVVASSPILTRIYSPDDFGALAVFSSIIYVATTITALRYDAAIPIPKDDRTAANVLGLSILLIGVTSALTFVLSWILREQIAAWTNVPVLGDYLWLLALTMLGSGLYSALNNWGIRAAAYGQIARARLSQGIAVVALQVGLGLIGLRPFGLLAGFGAGQSVGTQSLGRIAWVHVRHVTVAGIRQAAIRFRSFALLGTPAVLFNSLGYNLPLLMLAALYDPQIAGWYILAQRVIGRPLQMIGASVCQAYWGQASKLVANDPEKLRPTFTKVTLAMAAIATPYAVALILLAPFVFPIAFGSDWSSAGTYTQILAAMFLLDAIAAPTAITLDVLQRQDLNLIREVIRVGLFGGAFGLASWLSLGSTEAVALVSIAGTLAGVTTIVMSMIAIRSHRRTITREHIAA